MPSCHLDPRCIAMPQRRLGLVDRDVRQGQLHAEHDIGRSVGMGVQDDT